MEEVLFVWRKGGSDWEEHSQHSDRDAAYAAGVAALEADGGVQKFKCAGEAFARGPNGTVIEVMAD